MKTILGVKGWDLNEFAISANAVLGIRDSGKTYTATEAAEELYDAGVPFIALDPIGVWHSLRVPGKGKGYPVVVAGGRHGDLPLDPKKVGAIVRAAMEANVSLVLDLFSVDLSKADWKRIVRETVEILMHENMDHGLRHVFIEEAAEFVPQRMTGADGQVFAAVEKLVRMGGNSKLGCTLINQRSADLNKSVLELCANVFVHRQTGKNTLLDLRKWVSVLDPDSEKMVATSLPDLKSGECWAFINDLKKPVRLKVPEKNSLHPDRRAVTAKGQEKRQPVPATAFVEQMRAKLAEKDKPKLAPAAASQPVQKSNTTSAREQARALAEQWQAGADSVKAGIPALLDAQHAASFQAGFEFLAARRAAFEPDLVPARKPIPGIMAAMKAKTSSSSSGLQKPATQPKGIAHSVTLAGGAGGLDSPLQRIVDAIRYWNVFGIDAPTHQQVAFIANYVPGSGTWNRYLSSLRSSGIIEPRGDLKLTAEGVRLPRDPAGDPSGEHLRGNILAKIDAPLARILTPLLDAYPSGMDHEAVADVANYVAGSGTWNRYLSSLRSLDLIEPRGELKAQAWLFPEGA